LIGANPNPQYNAAQKDSKMISEKKTPQERVRYPELDSNLILAEKEPKSDNEKRHQEETQVLATFAEHRMLNHMAYALKKDFIEYNSALIDPIQFEKDDDMFILSGRLAKAEPKAKQACLDQSIKYPKIKINHYNPWAKPKPQFEIKKY
jgi:hypothetical protein